MTTPDPFHNHRLACAAAGGWFVDRPYHAFSWLPGGGKRLVITFDNLSALREKENRTPWGQTFLSAQGWDVLGVMTKRNDWFRDASVWSALESLRDDGFFAKFPAISLYGASMGAYAAIAFAKIVPGCTVMAFAPQSTLNTAIAPFETRYRHARSVTEWEGPYNDAADSVAAAGKIFIGYDPLVKQDRAHVERLIGPNVTLLPMPYLGHKLPPALQKMKILKSVSLAGLTGTLTAQDFAQMFRARRTSLIWQAELLSTARAKGHLKLAHRLATHLMTKEPHWRIRHELNAIAEAMGQAQGTPEGAAD